MGGIVHVSDAELFEVSVENGLVSTTDTAATSSESVLQERSHGTDQTATITQARQFPSNGIMGMIKMWDSSAHIPLV